LNKSSLIGSTLFVLFAVSVISYARNFPQEPLKQEPQSIQNQTKADSPESTGGLLSKQPDRKPAETTAANSTMKPGTLRGTVTAEKALSSADEATTNTASGLSTERYVATAYSLRGRTASGRLVTRGLIAADPAVLPLGSRVRLEAGPLSGEYLVADTGGAVRGHRVDIWTPTSREAMRFGKRAVKLTVLSYGPRRIAAAAKKDLRARNHRN